MVTLDGSLTTIQSFGWAAGDVSLAAYIQASLSRIESTTRNVSALGAVMAFLYCTYIVTYAIASPVLGRYIDQVSNKNNENIHEAIKNIAGVQFTVISILVMAATFVPKGAFSLNPKILSDEHLDYDIDDDGDSYYPGVDGSVKEQELTTKSSSDGTQRTTSH